MAWFFLKIWFDIDFLISLHTGIKIQVLDWLKVEFVSIIFC